MNVIFIIGIFISLFQFVLLLNKKSKSLPDKILAIWMLIIALHLLNYHLYNLGYWDTYPHLVGITAPFPLLYGPLLYLYVSHSLKDNRRLPKPDYLHFLPTAFSYLYLSRFFFFFSAQEKRMVDSGELDVFQTFTIVLVAGFIISGIGYAFLSYRLLNRHTDLLEQNFSNTESMDLNWLKSLIWGVAIFFLVMAIFALTRDWIGIQFSDYVMYSVMVLGILILGYYGIRHQNIFTDNIIVEVKSKGTYLKSGLKEEEAQQKHAELLNIMRNEKLYLNSQLSLTTLAKRLELSTNHLSQIINQFEQQNFNDFVNQHRVEEFIQLAKENKQYSLLALALDAGFNSKSTFNKLFKKYKGITPSQYLAKKR